jgi:hypothetical protein
MDTMSCRRWAVLLCFFAGCSTHPGADLCDWIKPGSLGPNRVQPYGGVGIPQGPIVPVAPNLPIAPIVPGGGVIPGPAPLPGAGNIQLQPPTAPDFPPPPPTPPPGFGR